MLHTANPVEDLERVKGKLENLAPVDVKAGSKMAGDPSSILGSAGGAVQGAGGAEGISALFAASDERLKMNIKRSAMDALPGVPWASWEYKTDPGVRCYGVIAQDLEKVAPQFVFYRDDGMRMVIRMKWVGHGRQWIYAGVWGQPRPALRTDDMTPEAWDNYKVWCGVKGTSYPVTYDW